MLQKFSYFVCVHAQRFYRYNFSPVKQHKNHFRHNTINIAVVSPVLYRTILCNSCNPINCGPPGFSAHGNSPGENTEVGSHALLQGIFPTQGSNPDIPHCRLTTQLPHKIWIYDFKISFPFSKLPFHFDYGFLDMQKVLSLMQSPLFIFSFVFIWNQIHKTSLNPMSICTLSTFYSKQFMAQVLYSGLQLILS